MTFIKTLALTGMLACASLPSMALAQKVVAIPQDNSFQKVEIGMSGPFAGGYEGRAALKNMGGKLALCGVGIVTNIQVSSAMNQSLRGGTVKVNGKTVLKNFKFFAKAKRRNQLEKTNANCKVVDAPFPKRSDKIDVRFGSGTFRN